MPQAVSTADIRRSGELRAGRSPASLLCFMIRQIAGVVGGADGLSPAGAGPSITEPPLTSGDNWIGTQAVADGREGGTIMDEVERQRANSDAKKQTRTGQYVEKIGLLGYLTSETYRGFASDRRGGWLSWVFDDRLGF